MEVTATFLYLIQALLLCAKLVSSKNLLLIVADDAGFEAGALGNPAIRTPNLDALAGESVRFDAAFTTVSSCSPSRSAILTGLPTHQNGMYGLHHDVHHFQSFDRVRSLPKMLGQHGIRTGIIGKKHVGPAEVYPFDFEETEENNPINQVGRNITNIKLLVRKFLNETESGADFFLYVAFHDPHRCGHTDPALGAFCERFGNPDHPGSGTIPDWTPAYYRPEEVQLPSWMPQTQVSREEVAAQYTTVSRLDQGIGLVLKEFESAGVLNETLVIYSSDNGIPFANGRTNFYDSGIREPLLISHPSSRSAGSSSVPASTLDLTPTALDWFGVPYPRYHILHKDQPARLTGKSLLPYLEGMKIEEEADRAVFGSHNLHEVTMYYPMRYVRTSTHKLIHNLNYWAPFPVDQDFYISPSFQDMLQRHDAQMDLHWIKTLEQYYGREEWELFDLESDPDEVHNLAEKPEHKDLFDELSAALWSWQNSTFDPWLCSPHSVWEDKGAFKDRGRCLPLFN